MSKVTAAACIRETCEGCEIDGKLMCIHTRQDLLDFYMIICNLFVPFFAGMIVGKYWYGILGWFVLTVFFFGYFEALILCRHCPHYKEEGNTLKCHANWGCPKIPAYNPRPMNRTEQIVWLISAAVIMFYWAPFFISGKQWIFLSWGATAAIVSVYQLVRTKCNRCYMLSCPLNTVPEETRQIFYKYYPEHRP